MSKEELLEVAKPYLEKQNTVWFPKMEDVL